MVAHLVEGGRRAARTSFLLFSICRLPYEIFHFRFAAKPLLSMGTVGSINVERRVKPMKESILTKKRNRLTDSKAIALFRARENLRHLMNAKKILGKKITDSF